MFRILTLLVLLSTSMHATDKIQTVLVTIPVFHTWDEGGVKLAKIPFTGWDIDNPYYSCAFYSAPKVVFKDQKHLKQDINLISVYGLRLQSFYSESKGTNTIYISTSDAVKPETHPFSLREVIDFTKKSVRSDFPDKEKYPIEVTAKSIKEIAESLRE